MRLIVNKVLVLFCTIAVTDTYRILVVYPTPCFSHQRTQIAVSKGLANAGHELIIVTTDPFKTTNPNVTFIDISWLYDAVGRDIQTLVVKNQTIFHVLDDWLLLLQRMAEGVFEADAFKKLLNDDQQKFDAIIIENIAMVSLYMLAHEFKSALIGLSSMETSPFIHAAVGNPTHPILHPGSLTPVPENITFWTRCYLLYSHLFFNFWAIAKWYPVQMNQMEKYFPNTTLNIWQAFDGLTYMIEAVSPVLGHTRPLLQNTLQAGFLHIEEPKPLPEELKNYLDRSKGVIYLSFGTNVKSINIGQELFTTLRTVLGSLEYDVLWKFENDTMPHQPKNVRLIKWAPQEDLLAHKNIKLFITQGGQQSIDESVARGVPLLVIPFFGDQEYNGGKISQLGIGKKINTDDINSEKLKTTIEEIINNPKYKLKTQELANLVLDTPLPPVETVVWWIEYAIRNKDAKHLKYVGRYIPFYEYFFLDVIGAHLLILYIFVKILKKLIRLLVGYVRTKKPKTD